MCGREGRREGGIDKRGREDECVCVYVHVRVCGAKNGLGTRLGGHGKLL